MHTSRAVPPLLAGAAVAAVALAGCGGDDAYSVNTRSAATSVSSSASGSASSEAAASVPPSALAVPVFTPDQVALAMAGCAAIPSTVQPYGNDTGTLKSLLVGSWLRCGPASANGAVGYIFTAANELRYLVFDASGQLTAALSPVTYTPDFPLVPATEITDGGDTDGARIPYHFVTSPDGEGIPPEIDYEFADRDTGWDRPTLETNPSRMVMQADELTYVRVSP